MDLDDDVTVESLRTMYNTLMYSVNMALTGLADDVTVESLRTMYDALMAEVAHGRGRHRPERRRRLADRV